MQSSELILNAELAPSAQRAVQRRVRVGELYRIKPGVFTPLLPEEWPALVARNRIRLLGALFPGAVIGFRSALAGGVPVGGRMYLNYSYSRIASLPDLEVVLVQGPGRQEGDMPMHPTLFLAGEARQILENLASGRGRDQKAAGEAAVEERLVAICESRGEAALNQVREQVRTLAIVLGREKEGARAEQMAGAILGSRPHHKPVTVVGRALASKVDHRRIALFDRLVATLNANTHPELADPATMGAARIHSALYESYFSNYIEGTRFSIEQATEIVLEGKPSPNRPKDSKDVEGVFRQANEPAWRVQTLSSGESVLEQLRVRHADLMTARPEVGPGTFKTEANFAGNTEFVSPKNVVATLVEGSRRLPQVQPGFARAILAHFLVSEVHPFADGNGRIARLVMNAELSAAGRCRIIIPTIARDDYLGTLRLLTRESNPDPLIRLLMNFQKWTSFFHFGNLAGLKAEMKRCNAFEEDTQRFRLEWPPERLHGNVDI